MSCLLTEFVPSCDSAAAGGLFDVYIAKLDDVDTATVAANVVTAIAMIATKKFYKLKFRPQTALFTETFEAADANAAGFWAQNLSGTLSAHTPESRAFLDGLTQCTCGLVVVHVEDGDSGNGYQWVWGLRKGVNGVTIPILGDYVRVTNAVNNSGTLLADPNTATVTISGNATAAANKTTQDMSLLIV